MHVYRSEDKLTAMIVATVHPRLSEPHLSESSFIRTHKYGCEYHHYMLVNLINEYEYY